MHRVMHRVSLPLGAAARSVFVAWALGIAGCATSLSGFQPAHVPDQGHFLAEAGVDFSYPSAAVAQIVDAAVTLEELALTRPLTDSEKRALVGGAAVLGLNPPSVIPHLSVAFAPFTDCEIGARLTTSGARIAVRYQFLRQESVGVDLTVGVGLGRSLFDPPAHEAFESVGVRDFARWTIDFPIAVGRGGVWYRWWAGPRLLYAYTTQSITLSLPDGARVDASVSGHGIYVGGYGGVALGYKSFFLGPEVTIVHLFSTADVTALDTTDKAPLDGLVIQVGIAVLVEL